MTERRFPPLRLRATPRDYFYRRKKHTCDQNAERDVVEIVREHMMHGVALTVQQD